MYGQARNHEVRGKLNRKEKKTIKAKKSIFQFLDELATESWSFILLSDLINLSISNPIRQGYILV